MTISNDAMSGALNAFADRMRVASTSDDCAHVHFPEANDDTTQRLLMLMVEELGERVEQGADIETMFNATIHALHLMAAWGMSVGALTAIESAPIDWEAAARAIEGFESD